MGPTHKEPDGIDPIRRRKGEFDGYVGHLRVIRDLRAEPRIQSALERQPSFEQELMDFYGFGHPSVEVGKRLEYPLRDVERDPESTPEGLPLARRIAGLGSPYSEPSFAAVRAALAEPIGWRGPDSYWALHDIAVEADRALAFYKTIEDAMPQTVLGAQGGSR